MLNTSNFARNSALFLIFFIIFLSACSVFDKHQRVLKKMEKIANKWDNEKFAQIYAFPERTEDISSYRNNAFNILRAACEGRIYFKLVNKTASDNRANLNVDVYCNGAVDFKKAGQGFEGFARQEARKDNILDYGMGIILVKKDSKWLIENFDY